MRSLPLCLLLLASCGPKAPPPDAVGPTVSPPQNLFLRNAFDADPSVYIGRFVPAGLQVVDESGAMQLGCSRYVTYRKISGGGVTYDEFFNASAEAAVRVGVPLVASVGADASRGNTVRVKYALTEKMVAEISDPVAFESCCKQAPDQCTDRYIGEFLAGTGSVYYAYGHDVGGKGDGVTPQGATIGVEVKNGVEWTRSIEFPQPVYFAFKTTSNQWKPDGAVAGCGAWTDGPPKSSQGRYFVGISKPLPTEQEARGTALRDGREQVVRYVAEGIETGSVSHSVTTGSTRALTTQLEDEALLQSTASGVAKLVKDEAWCVQPTATPGGDVYVAKVLMFLPKEAEAPAADVVAEAANAR
jgi:hypothetical protein